MKVAINMRAKQSYGKQVKTTMSEIEPVEVKKKKKLTKSLHNRLLAIFQKKGHYIKI